MKTLIVEDEFVSRVALQEMLVPYGDVHLAMNGVEAIEAVRLALDAGVPYDLVCLDLLMPILGGGEALSGIRNVEKSHRVSPESAVKVVVTTALQSDEDAGRVGRKLLAEMNGRCDGHLVKPVKKAALVKLLRSLGLIA